MEITVPHAPKDSRGIRRTFSIVAAPGATDITFGVRMYDKSSSFKTALKSLHKGAVIHATTVGGDFILPKQPNTPLLFIAGGIGITPFISHLLALQQQHETRDIVLVYSVSSMDDLAYVDLLRSTGIRVIVVTQSNERLPVNSWQHVNKQRISTELFDELIPDTRTRRVYVSGPPAIVDRTKQIMKRLGVPSVTSDYFTGY
jgi:ferredoxin-NADP reductase